LPQVESEPCDEVAERAVVLLVDKLSPEARRFRLLGRPQRAALRAVEPRLVEVARVPGTVEGGRGAPPAETDQPVRAGAASSSRATASALPRTPAASGATHPGPASACTSRDRRARRRCGRGYGRPAPSGRPTTTLGSLDVPSGIAASDAAYAASSAGFCAGK